MLFSKIISTNSAACVVSLRGRREVVIKCKKLGGRALPTPQNSDGPGSSDRKRALCPCWNSLDRSSRFQIQVHIVSRQKQMCNSSDWHIQWSHIGVNFFLKKCFYSQSFPRRLRNVTTILLLPLTGINNFKGILYRDFETRQRNLLGKD